MRICYFSFTENIPSRDAIYLNGFRKNDVEIVECRDWTRGWKKIPALYYKHKKLKNNYDILWIGYSGHLLVVFARLISKKPVIFNALASLYEGMVLARGHRGFLGIKALWYWLVDFIAFRAATVTLVESNAQKEYLKKKFFLPDKKFYRAWTGANEKDFFFDPDIKKLQYFTVLFRGAFLPESGIEYLLQAANLLKNTDIYFRIIGTGMQKENVHKLIKRYCLENIEWIQKRLSIDELRKNMLQCHLSIRQLSNHERLDRTIPFKAFESLVMKLPYLTARNKGVMELLKENKTCIACNPADVTDLADKILKLKNDDALRQCIAKNGYVLYKTRLTENILAKNVLREVE